MSWVQLVFEDSLERAKEKEEKEAKKRRRLADDFTDLLRNTKAVTSTSKWEDVRPLIEDAQDFRALSDDSSRKKVFDDYLTHLLHKAKDKERKREKEDKVSFYLEVFVFSIVSIVF